MGRGEAAGAEAAGRALMAPRSPGGAGRRRVKAPLRKQGGRAPAVSMGGGEDGPGTRALQAVWDPRSCWSWGATLQHPSARVGAWSQPHQSWGWRREQSLSSP